MLVPRSPTFTGCITGPLSSTSKTHWRQAVEIGNESTAAERRQFYEVLLKNDWLPPALRSAAMKELGLSLREEKRKIDEILTNGLRYMIETREQAMNAQGLRPRGGVPDAAVAEIAKQFGIKVDTLKKRLQRLNKRARMRTK
jgi:hypothetical protein